MNLFLKRFKRRFIFKDKIKMTPTVFLSLFLIFTITLLTGMCTIFPKKKVLIYDGEEKIGHIHSNNEENLNFCVNEYLKTMGKEIKQNDTTKVEKLSNGNFEFKINRAIKINLNLFGKEKVVFLKQNQTVEDLLKDLKIDSTNSKIHVTPNLDAVLKENDSVQLQECEVKTKDENFQTQDLPEEQVKDLNLEEGKTVVLSNPVPRKIRKYVECKYVNGKLVDQKQKEEIVENGVAKKIAIGQKTKAEKNSLAKKPKPQQPQPQPKENPQPQAKPKVNPQPQPQQPQVDVNGKKVLVGYSTAYVAKGKTARMGPARFFMFVLTLKFIPYEKSYLFKGYGSCVVGNFVVLLFKERVFGKCLL